jgi:mono/diheme cytochrome c family protein
MEHSTAPRTRAPSGRRAVVVAAGVGALACALAIACAWPGRPVPVLPEISGAISGGTGAPEARLQLMVIHRETPSLHARQQTALDPTGAFRFEPVFLEVSGHEFSKHYRVYLHLQTASSDRVIWRADVSRLEAPIPIALDCDLARPVALGEVCRVRDPVRQPWLVAEGRKSFDRLCARCHGADGRAEGGAPAANGGASSGAPADLTRIAARHGGRFDRDRVAAWIEGRSLPSDHARAGMPVWGERLSNAFAGYAEGDELIGATLDPLVAYLESLQQEEAASPASPPVEPPPRTP